MQYILYLLLIAVLFGLVALCDFLLKKLVFRSRHTGKAVRMPRYSFILGILMSVFALMGVLYISMQEERVLWLGCWLVLVMGLFLLVNFFWSGIFYDDRGFTYRVFPRKGKTYRYGDITGQRTFVAKSGWNSNLYVGGDEVQLYAAMQGLSDFLHKAFYAWCKEKGLDPNDVENDPHNLIFFPEPEE